MTHEAVRVRPARRLYVLLAYCTSDPECDQPWLLGMIVPTRIRMARIPLAELHGRTEATR